MSSRAKPKFNTRYLVVTAMLSAVAFVLMLLEFPLPMLIPGFIKMDLSDLPALIGSFSLGPLSGVIISVMKNLLNVVITGTTTGCVGELANALMGAIFAAAAGWIYKLHKNRTHAIIGSVVGAAAMGLVSFPINYFVTYPLYATLFGGMEAILGAYQAILPSVDNIVQCLIIFNVPFTAVKGLLCALICFLIYKPLSPVLHGRKN